MLCFASSEKVWNAFPGVSSTSIREILAVSLSRVTPLTNIFSTLLTSLTIVPLALCRLESTISLTLYFFAISTERLFKTFAPRLASSSISSYEISSSFAAVFTILGSVVYTPSTSVYISQTSAPSAAARATALVSLPPLPRVVISSYLFIP